MNVNLEDLPWLPRAPKDFRRQVSDLGKVISKSAIGRLDALWGLSKCALDLNQLFQLATALDNVEEKTESSKKYVSLRIGLLTNGTADLLVPCLKATALRHGLLLDVYVPLFDQVLQEVLSLESPLYTSNLDYIFVAMDHRGFEIEKTVAVGLSSSSESLNRIDLILETLKSNSKAAIIVQNLPSTTERLFGSYDNQTYSPLRVIKDFNFYLEKQLPKYSAYLFDAASIAESVGLWNWHSPAQWHSSRIAFSPQYLPLYCDKFTRLLSSICGRSYKCLVLDLDNTLWGGVIGDDGLEGLVLGGGGPLGQAFVELQQVALSLRGRGIILAICSKNDDKNAREVFQKHPEMILRENHIAVFQANWREKSANLLAIAEALNIGVDSLVFVDDNPAEREEVRQRLPNVAVPEIPEDPVLVPRILLQAGYFEAVSFSKEDKERADYYQDNAQRIALQGAIGDLGAYLDSLDMTLEITSFNQLDHARISQLINKSNQFNLTTRRYTELQVQEFSNNDSVVTIQAKLSDKFGDSGLISVVIIRCIDLSVWEIDTWLMSCRVLKRGVEYAICNYIVELGRKAGISVIKGVYIPTQKNQLVENHFQSLGFSKENKSEYGEEWTLEVSNYKYHACHMDIRLKSPLRVHE